MEPPSTDRMPSAIMEQEDIPLRNREMVRNRAITRRKPSLCHQMNRLTCSLCFAAHFAALIEFSIVAVMLSPARTESAYRFLIARFCCQREMGLLANEGLSWICF